MADPLILSSPDDIALADKVLQNMIELDKMAISYTGMSLRVPAELTADMKQFDALCQRHQIGDYRQTASELKSLKTMAQWTVDVHCEMRNQPKKKLSFQ